MHWFTVVFLAAVALQVAIRWWLAARQVAAVLAHRDRVPAPFAGDVSLAQHQKAADYTAARARLRRAESLVEAGALLFLTIGGGIAAIDGAFQRLAWSQPWHGAVVVLAGLALLTAARLPLTIWRTFGIEARFGFNRTTPALFAADLAKSAALALLLGGPLLIGVLAVMERSGAWWWLVVWLLWLSFTLAFTSAWPRFIAPLFNRFSPLDNGALRQAVESLLARCGFTSQGVYVMNGSRRSSHGNAYFSGFGRYKRIVLFDTLLERLETPEIEAVLAHELGHFRLRHIRRRLIVSALVALAGLALLDWLMRGPEFFAALGVPAPSSHGALLLFLIAAPVFTFYAAPAAAWWARRDEFAADAFATRHVDPRRLARALVKLYRDNATTLTPDRLHSAFYDSHPPPLARIAQLGSP